MEFGPYSRIDLRLFILTPKISPFKMSQAAFTAITFGIAAQLAL
jgi:hypothetical protein